MLRASLLLLLPAIVIAQSAPPWKKFEVASVKPHEGPLYMRFKTSGSRLTTDSANLRILIMRAYGVRNFQIAQKGPQLLQESEARWDIDAKAEGDATPSPGEWREMLQSLLAERFHLQIHREMQDTPVYALVMGKSGPKFESSIQEPGRMANFSMKGRNNVVTMPQATMEDLADAIDGSAFVDRPIVNRTRLAGTFAIVLTYTPNTRANRETTDLGDINVFQAVEEQLGLKLEPRREPIEILVVDHAEKPTAN